MFKAVLLDLDGTLLNINMDYFLKRYFAKMTSMAYKLGFQESEKLAERIYSSTEKMIINTDSEKTNQEVFDEDFYKSWSHSREEVNMFFYEFYKKGFPQLSYLCRPYPGVVEMMDNLFSRNIKIVIATNPVFPLSAVEERLLWAGVGHFDYDLITSYENMHYCKPHTTYYDEICEKIGVKPSDCLMVGNDTGEDIIAGKIGMKTYLVEDMLIDNGSAMQADWRGNLQQLFTFIKNI